MLIMNMNKLKQAQKNPPLCKDESVTRGTTSIELPCISQFHSRGHTLKTAPLVNGEAPVSFSLTLSGGFDKAPSIGFHYPDSLLDFTNVY